MGKSFGGSHEPLCCLPGMTTACALPAEDLHKSGALGLVAPAAPSPLESAAALSSLGRPPESLIVQ